MDTHFKNLEIFIQIFSVFSALCSVSVVITYFIFKEIKTKRFLQLIALICFCNFFVATTSIIGFPQEEGIMCSIQGIFLNYFVVASWLWTTVLTYSMRQVCSGKSLPDMYKCHVFCWSIPLLATLLPLYHYNIGPVSDPNSQWCSLVAKDSSDDDLILWNFIGFWIWLLFAILLIIYWMCRFFYKAYFSRSHYDDLIREVVKKIRLYPISMSFCWLIAFFSNGPWSINKSNKLVGLFMTLGLCNGVFTTIIFYTYSLQARHVWWNLLFPSKESESAHSVEDFKAAEPKCTYDERLSNKSLNHLQEDLLNPHNNI